MAPGLVTPEKAARGKRADRRLVAHHRPANGREKTGYPTQKPEGMSADSSRLARPGDPCSTSSPARVPSAPVAEKLGRDYVLIDSNPEAVAVMRARLPDATG